MKKLLASIIFVLAISSCTNLQTIGGGEVGLSRTDELLMAGYTWEQIEQAKANGNFNQLVRQARTSGIIKRGDAQKVLKIKAENKQRIARTAAEKKQKQQYRVKPDSILKINCIASGGEWTSEQLDMMKRLIKLNPRSYIRTRESALALIEGLSSVEYCKKPENYPRYYGGSSRRSDDEDEEDLEEEYEDDSSFDEGTPQCDEGTYYEENGYC